MSGIVVGSRIGMMLALASAKSIRISTADRAPIDDSPIFLKARPQRDWEQRQKPKHKPKPRGRRR